METTEDLFIEVIYFFVRYLKPQSGATRRRCHKKWICFVKLERTSQVSFNGMEKILSFFKKHVCHQNPPCLMLFISYCFTHGTLNSHEQSYLSYTVPLCFKAKSENWKYVCQMLPFSHFLCLVSSGMHGSYNLGFHDVLYCFMLHFSRCRYCDILKFGLFEFVT